jgi:hypothetical protein
MLALTRLFPAILICCSLPVLAQNTVPEVHHVFHTFGAWKTLPQKEFFYVGFINGFLAGDRSVKYDNLAMCIEKNLSIDQAVAMIDKYSRDNPERWNIPFPMGVAEALTVKNGPCSGLNPLQ